MSQVNAQFIVHQYNIIINNYINNNNKNLMATRFVFKTEIWWKYSQGDDRCTKRRRGNNDGDPTNTTDQNRCEVTAAV